MLCSMENYSIKVQSIGHGIASRQGNSIFIHKKLKDYDRNLYKAILDHEKAHTSGYSPRDIALDTHIGQLRGYKRKYWGFILTHPSSWTEFFPFVRINGKNMININMIAFYVFILTVGAVVIWNSI